MERQLKKVLFITNIPAPYRVDFYNELGKYCDLTVVFEAKRAKGIQFNWNEKSIVSFKAFFLSDAEIQEKKIDWKIFKYIKNLEFDSIFITNYAYFTEAIALLSLKFRRIPYYYEVDGAMVNNDEGWLKKKVKSFFLSGAKGYFSPSTVSDDYFRYYTNKPEIYRYPFTSLKSEEILNETVTTSEKKELKIKLHVQEEFMVLAVGQFIHRKGFDVLIKAAQKLNKRIGVYIVGGEPTSDYLQLKQDLGLGQVHFEGFKSKIELVEYYKAADLFVHPTREDIWGLVINEAMAYGLPVITTNKCVAGVELIQDERCIVSTDDVDGLHKAIDMVLSNEKELDALSKQNLCKINQYSIEKMVQAHIEIIN